MKAILRYSVGRVITPRPPNERMAAETSGLELDPNAFVRLC